MSTQADLNEANIRIKRWLRAAQDAGHVKGSGKPEVRHSELWPITSRWRVYEQLKWTLDGTADGPIVETEACVASAQTAPELLHKYALWAQDENRVGYFQDRHLRGKSQYTPPPDPPEWAKTKQAILESVDRANENTSEWVRRSARAQMKWSGFPDEWFNPAWRELEAMGLVPK